MRAITWVFIFLAHFTDRSLNGFCIFFKIYAPTRRILTMVVKLGSCDLRVWLSIGLWLNILIQSTLLMLCIIFWPNSHVRQHFGDDIALFHEFYATFCILMIRLCLSLFVAFWRMLGEEVLVLLELCRYVYDYSLIFQLLRKIMNM